MRLGKQRNHHFVCFQLMGIVSIEIPGRHAEVHASLQRQKAQRTSQSQYAEPEMYAKIKYTKFRDASPSQQAMVRVFKAGVSRLMRKADEI